MSDAAAVAAVLQGGTAERMGTILFSDYLLAFHLVAVLLLTGIIGAVSLVQRADVPPPADAADAAGADLVTAEGEPA